MKDIQLIRGKQYILSEKSRSININKYCFEINEYFSGEEVIFVLLKELLS
jgi:hypothetical protein